MKQLLCCKSLPLEQRVSRVAVRQRCPGGGGDIFLAHRYTHLDASGIIRYGQPFKDQSALHEAPEAGRWVWANARLVFSVFGINIPHESIDSPGCGSL
jgi:hypothetical protein